MKSLIKNISLGLVASALLVGCTQSSPNTDHHGSHGEFSAEKPGKHSYSKRMKAKRLAKRVVKKTDDKASKKTDKKAFCFKDNTSIHYKASERCKK
ncbi:MAG: hypothetical protein DRG78_10840 [Epsilonproteobacteria bacterium]|nr:MAG: hypothetical protein DRG78_10840 [Campylobacterota bacterium]